VRGDITLQAGGTRGAEKGFAHETTHAAFDRPDAPPELAGYNLSGSGESGWHNPGEFLARLNELRAGMTDKQMASRDIWKDMLEALKKGKTDVTPPPGMSGVEWLQNLRRAKGQ
jgi:hypothetical protein